MIVFGLSINKYLYLIFEKTIKKYNILKLVSNYQSLLFDCYEKIFNINERISVICKSVAKKK